MAPTFGGAAPTEGLAATGGGGLGFVARGGFTAAALPGLDDAGVLTFDDSEVTEDAVRLQGAADQLAAAIPGKTAKGFAEGSVEKDFSRTLGGVGAAGAAGAGGAAGAAGAAGGGGGGFSSVNESVHH